MAIGAVLEPLIVVSLLAGGTLVNRNKFYNPVSRRNSNIETRPIWNATKETGDLEGGTGSLDKAGGEEDSWGRSRSSSTSTVFYDPEGTLGGGATSILMADPRWRLRKIKFLGWERDIITPNTEVHQDRLLSRLLSRFPFLVEVWYWALIYWVCRAAATLVAVSHETVKKLITSFHLHARYTNSDVPSQQSPSRSAPSMRPESMP